jgi:hypothetical protein
MRIRNKAYTQVQLAEGYLLSNVESIKYLPKREPGDN